MGIDHVDRMFQKFPLVRLECEHCGSPDGDVEDRYNLYKKEERAILCLRCWYKWCPGSDGH